MPVQNIVIEFTSDASGLQTGEEGVRKLLNLDKDVATSFDKTNTAIKQRQALLDGNTNALTKFAQSLQNVNKVAIGDTYTKVLQGIRQQLALTDTETKDFYANIIKNSKDAIIGNEQTSEVENLTQLINDATAALSKFETAKETTSSTPVTTQANLISGTQATAPIVVPVKLNEQDLAAIPEEIAAKTNDIAITPKVTFSDEEVQQAITNLKTQLSSETTDFDLLSKATAQAEKILPTLSQDSVAYKQLSAEILAANVSLDEFTQNQANVNKLILDLKSSLGSGFGKIDFGSIDFTNISQARAQVEGLSADALRFAVVMKQAAIAIQGLDPNSAQFKELNTLIQDGTAKLSAYDVAFKKVGNTEDVTGTKTIRAVTQLRNMRQELLELEASGSGFSKKFGLSFDELSIKAARLQDNIADTNTRIQQMSSDTFPIDALVGALTGVAAGFNAASGAAILFGGDQQEVQQAILKVQAAMQLLNGLQAISNLLLDQSNAKTGLQDLLKRIFTSTTKEQAAAQVVENVALQEGEIAQEGLNVAMLANPVGLVIAAIALLTAGIGAYVLAVNKTTEAEEKEKATIEASNEARLKAADSYSKEEANLNILLATARDETLTRKERQDALDKAIKDYPEWLHSLTLDNLYTSQANDLIAKQIELIKQRAFVQAAQDVYTEKLKKVAEAEAELNRIRTEGAGYFEKLKGNLFNIGAALTGTSAQENAVKEATDKLTDANIKAKGSFDVVTKGIEDASKAMHIGSQDADIFTKSLNNLTDAALGLPTDIKVNITGETTPFDTANLEKEKAEALAAAQYRVDVAKKGSSEELAARRSIAKKEFDEDIKSINAEAEARLTGIQKSLGAQVQLNQKELNEQAAAHRKYLDTVEALDKEGIALFFKDTIAASQAIVLQQQALGKEGSEAFFNARREVLIKSANEAKVQENITASEIKRINAQLNLDLLNLEIERKNKALEIQKSLTQDRLDLSEKGSNDELNAQIASLEIEKEVAINNAKGNVAAIQEINDNFRKQELDKIIAFNQKVREDTLNTQISTTNDDILKLQIQGQTDTNAAIVELKKKLIDEQAALEVAGIEKSVQNEELREAKINEVYDKALLDKKALEDAKNKVEIDAALKAQQDLLTIQKQGLDLLGNIVGQFGPARVRLNQQLFQNDLGNIKAERIANNQAFLDKLISQKEFNEKSKELDNAATNAEIANAERGAQAKIAAFDIYASAIQKGVDFLFDGEKQKLEQSAADNQALLSAKLISQDEFNKRQKKIKQEEAAVDKQKAIFDIIIDFAKQLFAIKAQAAALLSNPITALWAPVALAQIPILIASELISLGLVAAQKFKTGKINIAGPGTETSDSIPAQISRGESVITAAATKGTTNVEANGKTFHVKHEEALLAMNEGNFAPYLLSIIPKFEMPPMLAPVLSSVIYNPPQMQDLPKWAEKYISKEYHNEKEREVTQMIDYDKMGKKVGKEVSREINKRPIQIGFNEKEMYAFMKEKLEQENIAERRRGFRKK